MGRDTIQLETAVSTISQEYLLDFTSEYGISEDLYPELPDPEERICGLFEGFFWVDERVFPTVVDWCTNAPKDEMPATNTYSREDVAVLNTRQTSIKKQPETLLCLVGLSRRYFLGDDVYLTFLHDDDQDMDLFNLISAPNPSKVKTGLRPRAAHEVPFLTAIASRKSPLDFDNENPSPPMTEGKGTEDPAHETVAPETPPLPKKNMPATGAESEVSIEEEVASMGPRLSRVNDGADENAPPKVLRKDYAFVCPEQSTYKGKTLPTMGLAADSTFVTPADTKGVSDHNPLSYAEPQPHPKQSMTQEIDLLSIHGWVTRRYLLARMGRDQQLPPGHPGRMPRCCRSHSATGVVEESQSSNCETGSNDSSKGRGEAEAYMNKASKAKNADLTKELESLRTQFLDLQEFKTYEDDRVEKRYAKMDARLDALSIDLDEELYPHMLTAIAGRRRVIGHDPRLAVMKCVESIELRQAFANVVSIGIPKDDPIEVTMASLHLESDFGEDAPKWIRDLRPSTSQLKISVYPEVRDPRDPWVVKEEMLLEEAIEATVSRAEKKKRFRVVCRTYRVGSAHHARFDGIPVLVPIVAP
nr:hypothetical protein [Tanacetum cinerariifolium]